MRVISNTQLKSDDINHWRLIVLLCKGSPIFSDSWQEWKFRLKFIIRASISPRLTLKLLILITKQPFSHSLLRAQPDLPCKLHRPYLSHTFNNHQKLGVLCDHFQLITQCMPKALHYNYLHRSPYKLVTLTGKGGEKYSLYLGIIPKLNKEGEITLMLANEQRQTLALITFSLFYYQQQKTLFIGGLQGADNKTPHREIQGCTKACHGLFPKRLALEATCYLAELMGIEQIMAVGNSTHIYQHWRYRAKKKNKLHADYDGFWLSLGGNPDTEGHFRLPTRIARKPLTDIASKKRAEYRRRYAFLEQLETGLATHFM
ncbi:VirK/YbjX family protein [Yersinia similis]|uniref:Virulence factor n=1 Tax=Yersinia similis TaxID=367190 RepID=A0A0T9P2G9_9GAMM|nr:VirK/YbjX family protein [Yersinia similis]AHK20633.1 virulence factor [Yersinia similis]CFQ45707.1 putative virulence factor [Yersinia similis]CNB92053.1 putative virulence factor [Yersinia similis]CNE15621.1 putative virulence factor [Yersinia similis]CNF25663.1 putative virulence factor [Yersinia similis]